VKDKPIKYGQGTHAEDIIVTEQDGPNCTDPTPMLQFLRGKE
jgi:hypothetical protein